MVVPSEVITPLKPVGRASLFSLTSPGTIDNFYGKAANSYGVLTDNKRILDPSDLFTFGLKMNFSKMVCFHLYPSNPHLRMSAFRRPKEQLFKLTFNNYF